jgi:hypothetical protein
MELLKLGFNEKDKREGKKKVLGLVAGGVAGAISNLAVAPIDTIKDTQKSNQVTNRNELKDWEISKTGPQPTPKPTGMGEVAKDIWTHEKTLPKKVKAFYRGSSAGVLKVAPAMAISFLAYDTLKEKIDKHYK